MAYVFFLAELNILDNLLKEYKKIIIYEIRFSIADTLIPKSAGN